jgi:hypothetical protein
MQALPRRGRTAFLTAALVFLGLGLRAYHYLRCPEIWHDEAAMAVNVLDRGFLELLGPLRFHEAGPPLFLWLEKAVTLALGDGLYSLRLLPFLASCAALLLMVPLSRRLLPPSARPWALLLFACSEQLAWHACEAKSYAFDVLAAVVLLYVFCREELPLRRRLLWAMMLAPVLLLISYPACFLYGGLLVAAFPFVWREKRDLGRVYLGLTATVGATFLCVLLGPVHAQHDQTILSCWQNAFPDWGHPWTVPIWTVVSTSEVFRYCFKPLGQPLALFAIGGTVVLWRAGRGDRVVLMTLPIGLALLAALLLRYPYGGFRIMVYALPGLAVLIAAALPPSFAWLRDRLPLGRLALTALLLAPLFISLYRVVEPWERPEAAAAMAFVDAHRLPGDLVLGNDGIHIYHGRRLGRAFWWTADPYPEPGKRLWILFTDLHSHAVRVHGACVVPQHGSWKVVQTKEFHFTSVVLLTRQDDSALVENGREKEQTSLDTCHSVCHRN